MNIILGELSQLGGMRAEDPKWVIMPLDEDAHSTHHSVLTQQRRTVEPCLCSQVFYDDGPGRQESITRLRVKTGANFCVCDKSFCPTNTGAQKQGIFMGKQFQYLAVLDLQSSRNQGNGFCK